MKSHAFSVTGALFSALLTAWYVCATPETETPPIAIIEDIAIVPDAIGLPHFVDARSCELAIEDPEQAPTDRAK